MTRRTSLTPFALLALAALISAAGCKSNSNQTAANSPAPADSSQPAVTQPAPADASDPANANIAPVSNVSSAPAPSAAPQSGPSDETSPSTDQASYDQAAYSDPGYGDQSDETAPQPPPPLPEYQQPADPGDGYLWTPGYWSYASAGYYWVPGVWVQAPYEGALWTPGWWGWNNGHYYHYRGYWGRHIGFYGGVNYGFGYTGVGYQGGYWNNNHFFYNRAVNNINVTLVHNVYEHKVTVVNNERVSFNGGQGGIQRRPQPAELAAYREPHAPPMSTQLQIRVQAGNNRANFVTENHGRPAEVVIAKPVMADHNVRPMAPPPLRIQPAQQRAVVAHPTEARPNETPAARPNQPNRAEPARPAVDNNHPGQPARPETRPAPQMEHNQPVRPEMHPAPAPAHNEPARPAERPAAPARTEPARPAEHPAPAQHPQARPEQHTAPQHTAPQHPAPKPEEKPRKEEHPQ